MGRASGSGATSPNLWAQLDISSSARGLFIPRMTTTGRFGDQQSGEGVDGDATTANQLLVNMDSDGAELADDRGE